MTKQVVNKALLDMAQPVLEPLGFKKKKGTDGWTFLKVTDFGYNEVILPVWQYGAISYVGAFFMVRLDVLNKVFLPFSSFVVKEDDQSMTLGADIGTFGYKDDHKIKTETPEELAAAIEMLKGMMVDQGLPFFERFTTVADVDKEFNRENRPKGLYCHDITQRPVVALTAAALNKNPAFDHWEKYYREALQQATPVLKEKYERLVVHLRQQVLS
ncbi:hypothetical protein HB364_25215 [Pseudoflavitalea sp. X16]|uniref:hypothetical protein n=1 Tax=Paraflavitalea devenefica TaxID=2716334 RepID=UPI00141E58D3|nr:hypothetical protein [Paraflavitalea devenefica]NII28407.1 hypothetical protein [Paraflavitalea devenefica]